MVRFPSLVSFGLLAAFASAAPGFDHVAVAEKYLRERWGFDRVRFKYTENSPKGVVVNFKQVGVDPFEVVNSFARVHFDKSNKIVSLDQKRFMAEQIDSNVPTVSEKVVISKMKGSLNMTWDGEFDYGSGAGNYYAYYGVGNYLHLDYKLGFLGGDGKQYTGYIHAREPIEIDWIVNAKTGETVFGGS